MTKNKAETMESVVSSRLDDLFSEADPSGTPFNDTSRIDPDESPIIDLNAIVLSIEWEITDEILARFIDEISRLKVYYRDDKILFSFLQLHGSVGKYLSTQKVNAHPDSIRLLQSIYTGFEQVVTTPEMTAVEKKTILLAEVNKFKELKEKVRLAKEGVPAKKDKKSIDTKVAISQKPKTIRREEQKAAVTPVPTPEIKRETPEVIPLVELADEADIAKDPEPKDLAKQPSLETEANLQANREFFDFILEEVRKTIKAELKILKDELKVLLQG